MENTFNFKFKKKYLQGYTFGLHPVFYDCEDMLSVAPHFNTEAFIAGFHDGRLAYEKLNGNVANGIPHQIITEKLLDGFLMEGKMGMSLVTDGFTSHQITFIRKYYLKGCSQYESDFDISLYSLLAINDIDYN